MHPIPEHTVEAAATRLTNEPRLAEDLLLHWQQEQPVLLAFLTSENLEALSRQEQEYLLFLAMVIYLAAGEGRDGLPAIDAEALSAAEEQNWELLGQSTKRGFHERLDPFFEHTSQEDLLAFLEDALSDEEDGWSTREGREAMFVSLKSVVDCLAG